MTTKDEALEKMIVHFDLYKCFEKSSLDIGYNLSIIMGQNNSGKSKLLDIIENINNSSFGFTRFIKSSLYHRILLHIENEFSSLTDITIYNNRSDLLEERNGQKLDGLGVVLNTSINMANGRRTIKGQQDFFDKLEVLDVNFVFEKMKLKQMYVEVSFSSLPTISRMISSSFSQNVEDGKTFLIPLPKDIKSFYIKGDEMNIEYTKRLSAERDIVPEVLNDSPNIKPTGIGITSIIASFLHKNHLDEKIVENEMLNALNEILGADYKFNRITAQQLEGKNEYEIFLRYDDEKNQRLALSEQGSGLKTILCVLAYIYLDTKAEDLSKTIFLFEELENNLHPYVQKRLINFLYKFVVANSSKLVITTHSPFIIESYFNKNDAQIIAVTRGKSNSTFAQINNRSGISTAISNLGVKASDILQSNFIIWLEGPSDRIYINKWLELISNGELEEHIHYECMFYGGSLLEHISLEEIDDELENHLINLININRKSAIMFDSDKSKAKSELKPNVTRVSLAAEKNGIFAWITECREIECYIHQDLLIGLKPSPQSVIIQNTIKKWDNYESFYKRETKLRTAMKKHKFAEKIIENMLYKHLNVYDLRTRVEELARRICIANDLSLNLIKQQDDE